MNITKISIERPTLLTVAYVVLLFLGGVGYWFLNYELVPKFNPPVIAVTTVYPGAAPNETENSVTKVIEDALSSVENTERITSVSMENFSLVKLKLTPNAKVEESLQDAQTKLNRVLNRLPADAERPQLSQFDFDDLPVMRIGVKSTLPPEQFFELTENQIKPEIEQVEGVAQVLLLGAREKEIRVNVDPGKLNAYGISLLQVVQTIQTANLEFPTGKVEDEDRQLLIRLAGKFQTLNQLKELEIGRSSLNNAIQLKHVADIVETLKEPNVITRVNGQKAIGLEIKKQGDANAVNMSENVRQNINKLEERYADVGLQFDIAQDTSEFTLKAANAVMTDLGLAVLLVSLVMLLFLHSLRNSLIVLISIPTSIITTFFVMFLLEYSLNLLSLLGLSLAIGILVDDSIVVIENIYRHLEMGKSRLSAAFEGRMEIGFTALSITLLDVVVFLPIIFVGGIVSDLLSQFSVVLVTSTLLSLFVSFTLVPFLASRFSKLYTLSEEKPFDRGLIFFEKGIEKINLWIRSILIWSMDHKAVVLLIAFILFVGAISLVPFGFIGTEFTKAGDRSEFLIELELPKNVTLEQTNQVAKQVESYILSIPEVTTIFTNVGTTSSGHISMHTQYLAEMVVKLLDKTERDFSAGQMARKIKLALESRIPGLRVRPVEINILGLRADDAVKVILLGSDNNSLMEFSDKVKTVLQDIPGTVEVTSSVKSGSPEIDVIPDRNRMAALGINMVSLGKVLQTSFSGNTQARFQDENAVYDINIQLDAFDRRSTEDVRKLMVMNNAGQLIPIGQFATIKEDTGPAVLERTNRTSSVTIQSQVVGRPSGTVGNVLKQKLSNMEIPKDVQYIFGGQTALQSQGFENLLVAFIASVIFVYIILVALYNSYLYPFVVLFSIPLAIIGALLALALSQQALSIFSILGIVMLAGLVGKNVVLVVDFAKNLREQGLELRDALLRATQLRFRPILMTNITMIIGLLPIALAAGAGSEWKNGLAWALIGGLSSSMFLSLIVVPVVYLILDGIFPSRNSKGKISPTKEERERQPQPVKEYQ